MRVLHACMRCMKCGSNSRCIAAIGLCREDNACSSPPANQGDICKCWRWVVSICKGATVCAFAMKLEYWISPAGATLESILSLTSVVLARAMWIARLESATTPTLSIPGMKGSVWVGTTSDALRFRGSGVLAIYAFGIIMILTVAYAWGRVEKSRSCHNAWSTLTLQRTSNGTQSDVRIADPRQFVERQLLRCPTRLDLGGLVVCDHVSLFLSGSYSR